MNARYVLTGELGSYSRWGEERLLE